MRVHPRLALAAAVALAGVGLVVAIAGASPPRSCPRQGLRTMLIGDSNAVGLAPPMEQLALACQASFAQRSIGGSGAPLWAPQIAALLDHMRPSILLVNLGANDFRRSDPEKVRSSIATIVAAARSRGVRLVWISPPAMPFGDELGALAMWREHDLDEFRAADHSDIERAPDAIHYTTAGYAELARRIWRFAANLRT